MLNKFISNMELDNNSSDNISDSEFNFNNDKSSEQSNNYSVVYNKNNKLELYNLLNNYFKVNNIEDVYCEKCNKNIIKKRFTYLWQLPYILIIHINKTDDDDNYKYKYPLELDMIRYIHPENINDKEYKYELYAINIRIRFNYESGHYYSYCKNNDTWYRYNDKYINKIDDITEIDEDINMLFYKIIR